MIRLRLSNLVVRPNLLSNRYQQQMPACSVFELRDIHRRNPNLLDNFTLIKKQEWRESLFWGTSPPPPLDPRWAELPASEMEEAIRELEERPTFEAAIELVIITRELYNARPEGPARNAAAAWDGRVCQVLARDEFRFTPDMIDLRVESVVGRKLSAPIRPLPPKRLPLRSAPISKARTAATVPSAAVAIPVAARPAILPVPAGAIEPVPISAALTNLPGPLSAAPAATTAAVRPAVPATIPPTVALPTPNTYVPSAVAEVAARAAVPTASPAATNVERPAVPAARPPAANPLPPSAAVPTTRPGSGPVLPASPAKPPATLMVRDPDLKRLIQQWETLPDHVKKCMVMLLDAADATRPPPTQ